MTEPIIDVTSPPTPIVQLDAETLTPQSMSRPCPAREVAHLGFTRGVVLPCGRSLGHKGRHVFHMEWGAAEPPAGLRERIERAQPQPRPLSGKHD